MSKKGPALYVGFYLIKDDGDVWVGETKKSKKEMSLEDYQEALEYIPEEEIYPEIPPEIELTIAPNDINGAVYLKRPGLLSYKEMKETSYIVNNVLDETLIMEKISKTPHPNIIKYYGCRTRRGRIISLVLEKHDSTLFQYSLTPEFQHLDKDKFVDALESAVAYLHSLGLAHNDISTHNVMIGKDDSPVLIDFGSSAPYGQRLSSLGSPGWYKEDFFTSEKDHDDYALKKMRAWIHNPDDRG